MIWKIAKRILSLFQIEKDSMGLNHDEQYILSLPELLL